MSGTREVKCYAAMSPKAELTPWTVTRRAPGPSDICIDIKYAGICHSDIHQVNEDWGSAIFPMVPGHEIAGIVTAVGANVSKFKPGDLAGIGCMVDSCRDCRNCKRQLQQFCQTAGGVMTYNSKFKYKHCPEYNDQGGAPTYGGYSQAITVDESFALIMPKSLDLAAATPLLCAGITTYSPMKHQNLKPTDRFGVIGLGGLGHMALKFAKAWGCQTTVISRGNGKKESSMALGADNFIDSTNPAEMKAAAGSLDFIINCVAADHDIASYMQLLDTFGKMVLVAVPPSKLPMGAFDVIGGNKTLAGSLIGGIAETQEMLDFCAKHNIVCDIEQIGATDINTAYKRCISSDVKYRFVIDASTF